MDGASYHKRRANPVPTGPSNKSQIIDWFLQNNLLVPSNNEIGKASTKKKDTFAGYKRFVNKAAMHMLRYCYSLWA
jgi:hypothetical protein